MNRLALEQKQYALLWTIKLQINYSILAYIYTVQYTFSDVNFCSITFLSLGVPVYTIYIYDIVIVFIYFSFTIAPVKMG